MVNIKTNNKFKEYSRSRVFLTFLKKEKEVEGNSTLVVFSNNNDYYNLCFPLFNKNIFSSKKNENIFIYEQNNSEKILFYSLTEVNTYEKVRHLAGNIIALFKSNDYLEIDFSQLEEMASLLNMDQEKIMRAFLEGIYYGSYEFKKYLSKSKTLKHDVVILNSPFSINYLIKELEIINNAFSFSRDLVNEPPNFLNAQEFVRIAKKMAKENKLIFESQNNRDLEKNKLAAILAVNAGSKNEARLLTLQHAPRKFKKTILLVGKGVTFDSGGLCLKPSKGMDDMKMDMSGAAVVLGTLLAVSRLQLPLKVIGIMPLTDNMTGGAAFRVGDVLKTHSGKTVEVLNTDAEGRLILADGLSYGLKKYKVDEVIDIATLTGACLVALGTHYAGLFSNDDDLANRLTTSGVLSGEQVWRLPLDEVYNEELKSSIADLKNIGGSYGGSITAAKFLENFVGETPWAHLDIASTMEHSKNQGYFRKGGSAFGVRLLLEYLKNIT